METAVQILVKKLEELGVITHTKKIDGYLAAIDEAINTERNQIMTALEEGMRSEHSDVIQLNFDYASSRYYIHTYGKTPKEIPVIEKRIK
jgi:hypothetical protein